MAQLHDLQAGEKVGSGSVNFPTISVEIPTRVGTDRLCPTGFPIGMDQRIHPNRLSYDRQELFFFEDTTCSVHSVVKRLKTGTTEYTEGTEGAEAANVS